MTGLHQAKKEYKENEQKYCDLTGQKNPFNLEQAEGIGG